MLSSLTLGLALTQTLYRDADVPELDREFRGAWVATVANIDWPSQRNLTTAQLKAEMEAILDECQALNLNAVVLQVRPSGDAFYVSELEPWSYYLTGLQGQAPTGGYDPLEHAIEEAHKRGIELHAWLNPFRAKSSSQGSSPLVHPHLAVVAPHTAKQYGNEVWFDPGEKVVRDHTLRVFMDLVDRYDLDGIHIDDYFYPYPVYQNGVRVEFPDDASYHAYRSVGGALERDDWRRANVNSFVRQVYYNIKARKPHVKFGISPFGIYRPGIPAGINGFDQYREIYADARLWLRQGLLDYWSPQLYWRLSQTQQAYGTLLDYWTSENWQGRHVWPGNFTSSTNPNDGNWPASEISNQILRTRQNPDAGGNLHFSMRAFYRNYNGVASHLKSGVYALPAVVPASPWLDPVAPGMPDFTVEGNSPNYEVKIVDRGADDVRFFVVQTSRGDQTVTSLETIPVDGASVSWIAVRALDKVGNASESRVWINAGATKGGGRVLPGARTPF